VSLLFPNVPNLPGVPQVERAANAASSVIVGIGAINQILNQSALSPPIWGVFDSNNNKVISPDSIREFNMRAEFRISNYPIQQGGFAGYNKVRLPEEYSLHMVKGGDVSARQQFEAQVATVAASISMYTIITPEQTYLNCNMARYEKTRKGAGNAFFTEVDLFFELIVPASSQYSTTANPPSPTTPSTINAKTPTAVPNASQGTVTPAPFTPSGGPYATQIPSAYGVINPAPLIPDTSPSASGGPIFPSAYGVINPNYFQ
jgi:hypothetical protein